MPRRSGLVAERPANQNKGWSTSFTWCEFTLLSAPVNQFWDRWRKIVSQVPFPCHCEAIDKISARCLAERPGHNSMSVRRFESSVSSAKCAAFVCRFLREAPETIESGDCSSPSSPIYPRFPDVSGIQRVSFCPCFPGLVARDAMGPPPDLVHGLVHRISRVPLSDRFHRKQRGGGFPSPSRSAPQPCILLGLVLDPGCTTFCIEGIRPNPLSGNRLEIVTAFPATILSALAVFF
ncbi:hypothetical protein K227x_27500 [Rubripirellula lacrimiformis]|uniref:Uncharacterized protein n=1 Tax=Rubripirellula lacrimiformis TaxID=1930273 RepID=A0A517NB41_9BACT|nr:hypothetical protein K227x_27500 [Rubripirellula lacrimiformis]